MNFGKPQTLDEAQEMLNDSQRWIKQSYDFIEEDKRLEEQRASLEAELAKVAENHRISWEKFNEASKGNENTEVALEAVGEMADNFQKFLEHYATILHEFDHSIDDLRDANDKAEDFATSGNADIFRDGDKSPEEYEEEIDERESEVQHYTEEILRKYLNTEKMQKIVEDATREGREQAEHIGTAGQWAKSIDERMYTHTTLIGSAFAKAMQLGLEAIERANAEKERSQILYMHMQDMKKDLKEIGKEIHKERKDLDKEFKQKDGRLNISEKTINKETDADKLHYECERIKGNIDGEISALKSELAKASLTVSKVETLVNEKDKGKGAIFSLQGKGLLKKAEDMKEGTFGKDIVAIEEKIAQLEARKAQIEEQCNARIEVIGKLKEAEKTLEEKIAEAKGKGSISNGSRFNDKVEKKIEAYLKAKSGEADKAEDADKAHDADKADTEATAHKMDKPSDMRKVPFRDYIKIVAETMKEMREERRDAIHEAKQEYYGKLEECGERKPLRETIKDLVEELKKDRDDYKDHINTTLLNEQDEKDEI